MRRRSQRLQKKQSNSGDDSSERPVSDSVDDESPPSIYGADLSRPDREENESDAVELSVSDALSMTDDNVSRPQSGASTPRRYGSAVVVARRRQGVAPPTAPPSFLVEDGPFAWLLYQPHTLSWLAVVIGIVLYCGFMLPGPTDTKTASGGHSAQQEDEINGSASQEQEGQGILEGTSPGGHHEKLGLLVMAVVFLCYCGIQMRDSVLIRPHPSFWRVIHGIGILYLLVLVYILMHSADSARRRVLPFFFPDLGVKPANLETAYADDCRIYAAENEDPFQAVKDTFFDIFTVAHLLGWVGKAMMLRDWRLLVILSVAWELIEYSLQDKLLNFHECWWDHWILDMTVCNMGGAAVGMLVVHTLDIDAYHWSWHGADTASTSTGTGTGTGTSTSTSAASADGTESKNGEMPDAKIKDVASQSGVTSSPSGDFSLSGALRLVTPLQWVRYEWQMFSSWRRFLAVLGVLLAMEVVEINAFTLKHVLWLPPECPLNPARLFLWFFLAQPALHEWYLYIVDEQATRIGQNMWLATAVVIAEAAVTVKFGTNFNDAPIPDVVWYSWGVALCSLALWLLLRFGCGQGAAFDGWMRGVGGEGGKHGMPWLVVAQNCLLLVVLAMAGWLVWAQEDGLGRTGCAQTYGAEACRSRKW